MKRFLSILLAFTMVLSLCIPAFAEEAKNGTPAISVRDMSFYLNDLDDMKTYPVYFMGESVNALKQRGVPGRGLPLRSDHPTKNHIIF